MKFKAYISREAMDRISDHAEREYPDECCGIVTQDSERQTVHECENIQNRLHNDDPVTHIRDARTAYVIDRGEAEAIFSSAKERGDKVMAFYHSHTDHDAYFSETDEAAQTVFGEPEFPDALHIVVSVKNGKTSHFRAFIWDGKEMAFRPVDLTT